MIMNNIESDTEEVFYQGASYKRVNNQNQNLKKGFGKKTNVAGAQNEAPVFQKQIPVGGMGKF